MSFLKPKMSNKDNLQNSPEKSPEKSPTPLAPFISACLVELKKHVSMSDKLEYYFTHITSL